MQYIPPQLLVNSHMVLSADGAPCTIAIFDVDRHISLLPQVGTWYAPGEQTKSTLLLIFIRTR